MNDMLGALQESSRLMKDLFEKLSGKESEDWFEELKFFLKRQPCWASEMIPTPLEWLPGLGPNSGVHIPAIIGIHCESQGDGWRLPSETEIIRYINKKEYGFIPEVFYWTNTPRVPGSLPNKNRYCTLKVYQGLRNCCGSDFDITIRGEGKDFPHLRLCRPMKIPGH